MNRARSSYRRSGFTLVELLVVIGVIMVLTGIVVTTTSAVARRSDIQQTRVVLDMLEMTAQEWHAVTGRTISIGIGTDYDMQMMPDQWGIFVITELLEVLLRVESARSIFAGIPPRFVHRYSAGEHPPWTAFSAELRNLVDTRYEGSLTVVDAWNWPIYATHPGPLWEARYHDLLFHRDGDGTIETPFERRYGVCRGRSFCFVSAGPSGDFGSMSEMQSPFPGGMPPMEAVRDNIYSYPPDAPKPQPLSPAGQP